MAYCNKFLEQTNLTFWCILGDGECAEGSTWEAVNFASYYKLSNIVAVVDVNRLGQVGPTMIEHDVETYRKRFDAFGWNTIVVDGHDIQQLIDAYKKGRDTKDKPTMIVAKTFKGAYFGEEISNLSGWHGKPMLERTEKICNESMKH